MSLALDIFMQSKKKAAANRKTAVKTSADNMPKYQPKYEGIPTLRVMVVGSLDLGKLRAYF